MGHLGIPLKGIINIIIIDDFCFFDIYPSSACADPESFVREGPTLTVFFLV